MQDELVFVALCDEVKVQVVDEKLDLKKVSLLSLWWRFDGVLRHVHTFKVLPLD